MTQLQEVQLLIKELNNVEVKMEKVLSLQRASEVNNSVIGIALQVEDVNKRTTLEADSRGEDSPFGRMFGGGIDPSLYTESIMEVIDEGMFLDVLGVMWKRLEEQRGGIVKQLKGRGVAC